MAKKQAVAEEIAATAIRHEQRGLATVNATKRE